MRIAQDAEGDRPVAEGKKDRLERKECRELERQKNKNPAEAGSQKVSPIIGAAFAFNSRSAVEIL